MKLSDSYKKDILKFIKSKRDKTPEEIKKLLREKYSDVKFYNDDIFNLISEELKKEKDNKGFER